MRQSPRTVISLIILAATPTAAQDVLDTFSGNVNQGQWSFGGPSEALAPTGGNPGPYLRSDGLDTTIPWLRSGEGTPFTGNFRAMGVTGASIDVNVFSTDFNIGPFPLTVILFSDNGSPANSEDDWLVYKLGDSIPAVGAGWKHVTFSIPASSPSLPAGWGYMAFGAASPAVPNWDTVITNVTSLQFSFGDPDLFYIFQMWTVGADNVLLTTGAPCYANCDASTAPPILNANDFQCFLNLYAAGDSAANCDGSTAAPVLNANDFQCFLNVFAVGCG